MIVGHDEPINSFLSAMRGDRPHHAWLLAGPEGVGKATSAMLFARRLLAEAADPTLGRDGFELADDHRIARLVDARTHPDLAIVERAPKDLKAVRDLDPRDWPDYLERARNITVDQVRALTAGFALKPSLSERRMVVVDAIDDMERGAANALLKALEEPPAGTVFLLVSHAPGRLLPTIRSRCRSLAFRALADDVLLSLLARHLPGTGADEIAALGRAGKGSPGRALAYAGLDLGAIEKALKEMASGGDRDNSVRNGLAVALSAKAAQKKYEAFLARTPAYIASEARQRGGAALAVALDALDRARSLAESAVRQSLDPHLTVFALGSLVASLAGAGNNAKA